MGGGAPLFVWAFGLSIAFCAPPGPVTAEALRRGLARGFRPALLLELGSLVGDATWAAIALAGSAFLVQNAPVRLVLGAAGAFFLLHLAWAALSDARTGRTPPTGSPTVASRGDFATGAFVSLANPNAVAYWLGIGGGIVAARVGTPGPGDFAVFFGGFMLGATLWCFFISGLIAWGRQWMTPAFFRAVNLTCALALGYFGLRLCVDTLGLL